METQNTTVEDIGQLKATVINEKQNLTLRVTGTFPTNGERPYFHFVKLDGFNPTIFLLKLEFGELVDKNGKQLVTVVYPSPTDEPEVLTTRDQYISVQVVDENDRTLATAIVK